VDHEYSVQEPSVLYENHTFEMWFTCGWNIEGMCYATSNDGISWNRLNSGLPLISSVAHGFVTKIGDTYYYYGAILPESRTFGRWYSTDRVTWIQDGSGMLPATAKGWEASQRGNISVWQADSTWHALYEALGDDNVWRIGTATSSDGLNWVKSETNPKIALGSRSSCGGPEVHFISGLYYVWVHCSHNRLFPTDIYRFQSLDLETFVLSPFFTVMARTTPDEGMDKDDGQVADPSIVEVNGRTYMFYDATDTQKPTSNNGIHLKLAVADMSLEKLVTTQEGTKNMNTVGPSLTAP
jgi:GH43 family beta-xylosidase